MCLTVQKMSVAPLDQIIGAGPNAPQAAFVKSQFNDTSYLPKDNDRSVRYVKTQK